MQRLILVIDDCVEIIDAYELILIAAGYRVARAENGWEGLRVCLELRPSAVLVDGVMPFMDGLEFLARLAGRAAAPPVIMISGNDRLHGVSLALGAHAFLRKPASSTEILSAVSSALHHGDDMIHCAK